MLATGKVSIPWASTFEFSTQLYDVLNAPATVGAAMWVVEYDSHAAPMIQHMRGQGYRVLHQSAENLVFGR